MFNFLRETYKAYILISKEKKAYESGKYYADINEIPLFNYWKCSEGELKYLWKEKNDWVPIFFQTVFNNFYFQLDFLDTSKLRKQVEVNYFMNKYLSTKDIKYKRKSDTKEAELKMFNNSEPDNIKLNDIIKYVQITLKLNWQIDQLKISAGYFFSLYNEAIKKNGNT